VGGESGPQNEPNQNAGDQSGGGCDDTVLHSAECSGWLSRCNPRCAP
jgi:hypothetical protein